MSQYSKPFKCKFCDNSYKTEIKLLLHFDRKHIIPKRDKELSFLFEEEGEENEDNSLYSEQESSFWEGGHNHDRETISATTEDLFFLEEFMLAKVLEMEMKKEKESGDSSAYVEEEEDEAVITRPIWWWNPIEENAVDDKSVLASLNDQLCTELLVSAPFIYPIPKKEEKSKPEDKRTEVEEIPMEDDEVNQISRIALKETLRGRRGRRPKENREVFQCVFCNKILKFESQFHRHVMVHIQEKPFWCEWCGDEFGTENYLTKHVRTHTEPARYPCPICPKHFTEMSYLRVHVRAVHSKVGRFRCKECKKKFDDRTSLKRHVSSKHSGRKPKQYKCEICGNSFSHPRWRKSHMKRVHNNGIPFKCTHCGEEFPLGKLFIKHNKVLCSESKLINRETES